MAATKGAPVPVLVAVDLVILTIRGGELCVLLVRRGVSPYRGRLALPGGFVEPGEDLESAALRELEEETGLGGERVHVEQLATYGAPRRDPRGRVVSVAYLALAADLPTPTAGSDAADAEWVPVAKVAGSSSQLAFDHARILDDGVERARAKLEYSSLATAFCAETFTISDLRKVYETVWGVDLDARNFHRKVTGTEGFVEETGETSRSDAGRPAKVYRRGPSTVLHPPLVRGAAGQR